MIGLCGWILLFIVLQEFIVVEEEEENLQLTETIEVTEPKDRALQKVLEKKRRRVDVLTQLRGRVPRKRKKGSGKNRSF